MALLKNREIMQLVVFNFEYCLASELMFGVYSLFAFTPVELGE